MQVVTGIGLGFAVQGQPLRRIHLETAHHFANNQAVLIICIRLVLTWVLVGMGGQLHFHGGEHSLHINKQHRGEHNEHFPINAAPP